MLFILFCVSSNTESRRKDQCASRCSESMTMIATLNHVVLAWMRLIALLRKC